MANWITHLIWKTIPAGAFTKSPDYEGRGGAPSGGSSPTGTFYYVNQVGTKTQAYYDYYLSPADAYREENLVYRLTTPPTGKQGRDYVYFQIS